MQRIELPGFVMLLHGDNYLEEQIIKSAQWEPSTTQFIKGLLRPGMTVADIGANIGYFSLLMASLVGPEGEVHAFEPYSGYLQRMQLSLAANSFTNIHLNEYALSSKQEHHELYKGLASARMHRWSHENPVFNKVNDQVVVPCITFDEYAGKNLKRLDVMRIGVDGFEMSVLEGARRSIDKYHPIIVIELYEQALKDAGTGAAEMLELFRCSNYLPYSEDSRLFDYNTLLELVAKDPSRSINVVFRPECVAANSNSSCASATHISNVRPRSKSKQGRISGPKRRLGLVLNKDFHEKNQWCSATTFYLVEAIKSRFEYVYIQSQSDYEENLGSVDILISMEPGWASPVLELTRTSGLREKLSGIPSYIFYSDPHSGKWREDYFLNNGLDYVLTFYNGPIRYHFRKIPPNKLVHFPWSVPDQWVGNSPIRFNGQSKICCFGGSKSDAYVVRNWCRTFDFVESFANSGVENKIMTDDEYIDWLSQKDAAIAAGSDSVKYRLTVPKYFEIPAAGCLVFAQHTDDLGLLGFKHNENCIIFDRSNFKELAKEYLAHPQDYLNMRRGGRELIRERHTVSRRMDFLERHISMVFEEKVEQQRCLLHRESNFDKPRHVCAEPRGRPEMPSACNSKTPNQTYSIATRQDAMPGNGAHQKKRIHISNVARAADEQALSLWVKYGLNNRSHEEPPVVTAFPELIVLRGMYLRQLAEEIGAKYIAEVGTARGFQSFMLAQYFIDTGVKDGIIYTCDIDGSDVAKYKTPLTGDQQFTREQLWADTPQSEFVRFIHGDSVELAKAIEHDLDMAFIDGAHTEAAVKKDFECLSPFLHPGSIVIFDDCDWRFPGEQKEVERISSSLGAETQLIDFSPHVYKIVVMRIPEDYTPPAKEDIPTAIHHKGQGNKPSQRPGSNSGRAEVVSSAAAVGAHLDRDRRSSPDKQIDEDFEAWFRRICIESILARAKKSPLLWQGLPLEWEVCHEIMAYHEFSGGKFSVEQLVALSNRRYELLDGIWPSEPITRERLQRFYQQSAQILPWGHGVFLADHKVGERRKNWLRRVKLLEMLKALGADSVVDYGAGGGHTSLLAKAMDFLRIIHHEYGIFNDYVAWRAGFINPGVSGKVEQQFVISDSALPLSVSEPVQAVICSDVAEHVYDPDAMLDEIRRALAPNGYLVWSAMFGEGISCHLHGELRGSEGKLLERHGFKRAGDLSVHYPGHSGLYTAMPARPHAKKVPSDQQKTPGIVGQAHRLNAIDISADMDRNQWRCPDELNAIQWRRTKALLEHAYEHVPFYRRRFDEGGFSWNDIRDMDDFRRIPILKKTDIQQNLESLKASNYPADQLICDATGGSTGHPLTFFRNRQANAWVSEAAKRFRCWIGYQPQDKLALIWGADRDVPSSHPPNQRWLNSFNCSEQQIEAFVNDLVEWKPDAIRGYASSLHLVASYIKRKNLKAPHPKCIESAAEKLWDHQRALVEEVFQCRVFEMYGSREIPSLACECQFHAGLHIFSDIRLIEVIKEGLPAGPGADGSIIVTDLTNYGMPFIRYEIGDVGVSSDEICPCGRGFPLLKQVAGRVTSTIQTPDRRHIHGEYFTHLFYGAAGVRAFQVRQRSLDKIEVAIQPDAGFSPDLIEKIVRQMQAHLGPQVNVQWKAVDEIPPAPSGKRHFTISDVPVDFTSVSTEESKEVSQHAPATCVQGKLRVLFIVDVPGWAHDFKTDNLMRVLGDEYEMSKRYSNDVTIDDIDKADLIIVYYWKEFNYANMKRLMGAFRQNRDKLLLGISSHVELEGSKREKGLAILKELAAGVFVNSLLLYKEFSPVLDVPVFYAPNGVDTGFFTPSDDKKMSPTLRVGWAGSLTNSGEIRGYSDLIVPAVDSVDGVELVTAAREQKWRSHEEMRDFYRSLDVYICASRAEGTPNPCLEAAACGVPVLTTRVGNMPELLKHGVNGFFIERDVKDIAHKLTLLRDDPSLRRNVAQSMLRSIQQWDWRYQADNYRVMFERTGRSKPYVSVVIPCYNTAKYLGEAIESVLAQTYSDFEIIVVDDGSTDDTPQVVRSFDDTRISYIYQENKGLSGARNTGIHHSQGRYIAFLDADDYFLPNKLADQVAFLEGHEELGLVAGGYLRIDQDGAVIEKCAGRLGGISAQTQLTGNQFIIHCTLIRRSWIDKIGGFDESLGGSEEWDFHSRLAIAGCPMYRTKDCVCAYRFVPGSLSTEIECQLNGAREAAKKIFSMQGLPSDLAELMPKVMGFKYVKAAIPSYALGSIDKGRQYLAAALTWAPCLRDNNYQRIINYLLFWPRHVQFSFPSDLIESFFDNLPAEAVGMSAMREETLRKFMERRATMSSSSVSGHTVANMDKVYNGADRIRPAGAKTDIPQCMVHGVFLPPTLAFEVNNRCNVACIMCDGSQKHISSEPKRSVRRLTAEDLNRKLDGIEHINSAILSGGYCEPFLNQDLIDVISVLKSKRAFVRVISNGTLINRNMAEKIILAQLNELQISLHGGMKETAEQIMQKASFEQVVSNIRQLVELKRTFASTLPAIMIIFVGMQRNIRELSDLVGLMGEIGVQSVLLKSLMERQEQGLSVLKNESLLSYPELLRQEYERARIVAERYGVDLSVNEPYKSIIAGNIGRPARKNKQAERTSVCEGKTRFCLFPFEQPYVGISGGVALCCSESGRSVCMGNANDGGLGAVWSNDAYMSLRRALLTGENLPGYCDNCERAPMVDPVVMQMEIALRQANNNVEESKIFVRENMMHYAEYSEAIKNAGGVPIECIYRDDAVLQAR